MWVLPSDNKVVAPCLRIWARPDNLGLQAVLDAATPTPGVTYRPPIRIIEPNGPRSAAYRGEVMNSDQIKGAAQKTGGKVKEEFGKMTGNPHSQAKGKFDQAKGQARENVGDLKEVVKANK
jgi:uncharacterized protein YjbJ (UPF0337 family)